MTTKRLLNRDALIYRLLKSRAGKSGSYINLYSKSLNRFLLRRGVSLPEGNAYLSLYDAFHRLLESGLVEKTKIGRSVTWFIKGSEECNTPTEEAHHAS